MDAVEKHEIPQNVADRDRLIAHEFDRPIEILGSKFPHPRNRVAMNALESWRQLLDFSRSLEPRRPGISRESSALDTETSVRFRFGEMPGQLADGATFRVGTKVISVARQ